MDVTHPRPAPLSWLRMPRRTARLRLTALYGSLLLVSGAALVTITYFLFERATAYKTPNLPKVPRTPNLTNPALGLQTLGNGPAASSVVRAFPQFEYAQKQLTNDQRINLPIGAFQQNQNRLTQDQHQLAQAANHLAQAVHQLAQAGSAQAAQRATDSHQLLVNSAIALAIVAVLALLAGWLLSGRMLRPIRTITRTARRISSTSLHERLALEGPADELKELGDTLDGLFARLEAAFDAQRHFVANASHELRTPLTAERTLLQVALDNPDMTLNAWNSTAKEVLASSDEQARLLEALLTLASSESGLSGLEPVDLAAIVSSTLDGLEAEINRRGIQIDKATLPAPMEGDSLLVERLVANLLANAVSHNVAEGRLQVVTDLQEGQAVLRVTNTGPVIPPGEMERLFQPFQRLDQRRGHYKDGHGLGLSIVRAIATAHGATLTATAISGGGVSIDVTFPRPIDVDNVGIDSSGTNQVLANAMG